VEAASSSPFDSRAYLERRRSIVPPIEVSPPSRWADLQEVVARILRECGLEASTNQAVPLARGSVNVDVYARDKSTTPVSTIIVECKLWKKRVPIHVVHSFRSVVSDAGANVGVIVSMAGAQRGALEAAEHTNVQLVDWVHFQETFVRRWCQNFFLPTIQTEADPLIEYTEYMNSRIDNRASRLSADGWAHFMSLREKHAGLAFGLDPLRFALDNWGLEVPDLPLRCWIGGSRLPDDILDAQSLRALLEALTVHYRMAIRDFDAAFGGRA
jgi:hypothetical protein